MGRGFSLVGRGFSPGILVVCGPGLQPRLVFYPSTPRAVPFVLAARRPNRPLPMISLRVPVTPANRNYLRELRHAELRA